MFRANSLGKANARLETHARFPIPWSLLTIPPANIIKKYVGFSILATVHALWSVLFFS